MISRLKDIIDRLTGKDRSANIAHAGKWTLYFIMIGLIAGTGSIVSTAGDAVPSVPTTPGENDWWKITGSTVDALAIQRTGVATYTNSIFYSIREGVNSILFHGQTNGSAAVSDNWGGRRGEITGEGVIGNTTGLQFMQSILQLHGHGKKWAQRTARDAIAQVNLSEFENRTIRTYSKGMRQRIKIALALAHQPDILILDEPFNGLDPVGRHEMMQLFSGYAREGRTLLISSHILHEIDQMTNAKFQAKSRRSLEDTRKRYARLKNAMVKARSRMDPVLVSLNDYVLYLKHNLNAQAIGALKQEVDDIEMEVETLIRDIAQSIAEADDFLKTLD